METMNNKQTIEKIYVDGLHICIGEYKFDSDFYSNDQVVAYIAKSDGEILFIESLWDENSLIMKDKMYLTERSAKTAIIRLLGHYNRAIAEAEGKKFLKTYSEDDVKSLLNI